MNSIELQFVETVEDILVSLESFTLDHKKNLEFVRGLLKAVKFWVFNPERKEFGPSKFVGYKNMDFQKYRAARSGNHTGAPFNGHQTRLAVEKLLGKYKENPLLAEMLCSYVTELFGSKILENVDKSKWMFATLPEPPKQNVINQIREDIRDTDPDEHHRRAFLGGWTDAVKERLYKTVLTKKTHANMGNLFGWIYGDQPMNFKLEIWYQYIEHTLKKDT